MPRVNKQTAKKKTVVKKTPAKSGDVWDRVEPLGFDDDEGIKIGIYGKSATGKTTLWATFPKPILAIICSGGEKPGELRSIDTPEYRETIQKVTLKESNEILDLAAGADGFATVVLDHVSGFEDLVLQEILGWDSMPAQKTWGMATLQQYGQRALKVKDKLKTLLNLDQNVVMVVQEREFNTSEENDGSEDIIQPYVSFALSKSVREFLEPACDYVCETFIRRKSENVTAKVRGKEVTKKKFSDDIEYCLRTGPSPVYKTKFRTPKGYKLPDAIVDPDYDKIMEVIRGGE